jgi:hypothetical protein
MKYRYHSLKAKLGSGSKPEPFPQEVAFMEATRRGLITGLICFAAAPAIVRASSLMPVKVLKPAPMEYVVKYAVVFDHINPVDTAEGYAPLVGIKEILREEEALKKYGGLTYIEMPIRELKQKLPHEEFRAALPFKTEILKDGSIVRRPLYQTETPYARIEELKC